MNFNNYKENKKSVKQYYKNKKKKFSVEKNGRK